MARTPLPWLGGLLALYLIAPLAALCLQLSAGTWAGLGSADLFRALGVSAGAATVSSAVIALGGIPLAYVLARGSGSALGILGQIVQLPLAIPPLAGGILLLLLVGPYTPLGRLTWGALTNSFAGIVLAQTFVAAPFLIVAARSSFAALDPRLEEVAATLGHRRWARFWRVGLPVAWPGVRSGLLLAWVRAFGEFGATVMVAYHPYSLPVYTYVQFGSTGLAATLLPVLIAVLVALLFLSLSAWRPVSRARRPAQIWPEPRRPTLDAGSGGEAPLWFELRKRLGTFQLDVAHAAAGRRLAVVGPSGSGKTLLLRLLAGLETPDRGAAWLGDTPLHTRPTERRRLGYVPQEYGLFPHLTVWQQLTFGVEADPGLARYWSEGLGLAGLEQRVPAQLSAGQRQRVALARALACAPRLLLLDEPFSALDAPIRESLRREMRALQRELGMATLLVTHDPVEAAFLADDMLVLAEGTVLQAGPVAAVLGHPASPRVARLLGIPNVHAGRVAAPGVIETESVRLFAGEMAGRMRPGQAVTWCVRPEDVRIVPDGPLDGVVQDVMELGGTREASVIVGERMELRLRTSAKVTVGAHYRLAVSPDALTVWVDETIGGEPAAENEENTVPPVRGITE